MARSEDGIGAAHGTLVRAAAPHRNGVERRLRARANGLVEAPESWSHGGMRSDGWHLALRSIATLALLAVTLVGCPRSKGSGDDAKTAAPVVTAPPAPAAPALALGVHEMNLQSDDSAGLVLKRVTVTATTTTLDFTFTNSGRSSTSVTVSPPGDVHAMFLEWGPGKKASFQSATGIGVKPKDTRIPAGMNQDFSLVFGPLDPGVRTFDMYEGEDSKKVMPGAATYWIVRKIELK
jgi:hypothetical protein